MRRLLPLLALVALSAPARAQEYAFAPQSETGFRQLMKRVQEGGAGPEFVNANIGVDRTVVHVQLIDRHAARHELTLSPPDGAGQWRARYFKVEPGPGASPADAEQLTRLLDLSFDADPYLLVWHGWNDPRPVPPPEPVVAAWRRGGWSAFSAALVIQFLRPASLRFVVPIIALHALVALLCVLMLLSRRGLLLTIGVGAISFAALAWAYPVSPVIDDAALFMLLARDCVELNQCHLGGTMASLLDFSHGGAWVDLIVATRLLGGHADAVRAAVEAMDAAAVALVFHVVRRRFGLSLALPATALMLSELISGGRFIVPLSNTVSVTFPSVLCALLLVEYSQTPKHRYLMGAAFSLGWATSGHGCAGVLLPGLLIVGACGARPIRHALLALGTMALTMLSLYRQDLTQNLQALRQHHLLWPVIIGTCGLIGIGALLAPRVCQWSEVKRAWFVGLALAAPFGAMAIWLILIRGGYNRWYELPALAPLCVLLPATIHVVLKHRWIRSIAVNAVVVLFGLHSLKLAREGRTLLTPAWTFTDAEQVAGQIAAKGWSYEQLLHHLESPACRDVTSSLGLALPMAEPPKEESGRALRLRGSGKQVVLDEIASWLRPDLARVCDVALSGETRCAPMSPMDRGLFFHRADPPAWSLTMEGRHTVRYEIPLASGPSESRRIQVLDSTPWPACRWRIIGVEGAVASTNLPAAEVSLSGGPVAGRLILERPIATPECPELSRDDRRPPCLFELLPGESSLTEETGPRIAGF